jgi:hypothetical protein
MDVLIALILLHGLAGTVPALFSSAWMLELSLARFILYFSLFGRRIYYLLSLHFSELLVCAEEERRPVPNEEATQRSIAILP